jgi:hypothetical protein
LTFECLRVRTLQQVTKCSFGELQMSTLPRFREEQRFHQPWLWLLILGLAALQWWGFIQQIVLGQPWGTNPAPDWMMVLLWLLIGIGMPLFFLYLRLIVVVTDEAIDIQFRPLTRRSIPVTDVTHVEARTYAPLREYGGWGIRGIGGKRAYNVSGKRGVELTLVDGRKVMIGSQRAGELAEAIGAASSVDFTD